MMNGELGRDEQPSRMWRLCSVPTLSEIYKKRFFSVTLSKHVNHYGPRAGFLYYIMTTTHLSSTRGRTLQLCGFSAWEPWSVYIKRYFQVFYQYGEFWKYIFFELNAHSGPNWAYLHIWQIKYQNNFT